MNYKKFTNKTKFFVTILAALSVFILGGINTTKVFAFSGNGSGTVADPYIINSVDQLSEIRNNLTASYKLANDINLEGVNFVPIGNNQTPFTGTFDGNGYAIKNLKINQPSQYYVGLFGYINNATVKNLSIVDTNIIGSNCTGGLAGYSNVNSTISNCSIAGSSTVTGAMHTGGLVGYGSGLIDKCFTTTNVVSSSQNIGGLVGSADSLTITECYTTGNIKALNIVGGLVGRNVSSSTVIGLKMENCYSLSNIESTHPVNSIAGGLLGISNNDIMNFCYFAGTIKGVDLNRSGLIASIGSSCVIKDSFYDGVKSGLVPKNSYEVSSRLTTGMTIQQTFTNWNFDTIWAIDENTSYPYIKNLSKPSNVNVVLPLKDVASGKGSINDPYIISTKEQLNNVKFDLTANYKLANDIDLENLEFIPIGNGYAPFTGTFDGNGYTVKNLKINKPSEYYAGFFGCINNATVKNLSIANANIVGSNYTGGLAGYSNVNSTISNCSVTGTSTVTGAMHTGGLVGYGAGLIDKCFTTTNVVSSSQNVGGLVGSANSLTITESYTTGNIKASNIVGGLVGRNVSDSKILGLKMQNCYSLSNIEATHPTNSSAGGLLGISNNDIINSCYFAGTIKAVDLYRSGLIGSIGSSCVIKDSFYDGVKSGLVPKNSYEVSSRLTTGMTRQQTFTNWSFDSIWSIDENTSYPYLRNLAKPSNVNVPLPLKDVASGKGSIDDPYIIRTKEQLNNVKFDLTASYKLANDIDLENLEFIPIGNNYAPFTGTFDGNGYTVKNLKINKPSEYFVGFFGYINNANVKDLSIVNANIIGSNYTGGLAGCSYGSSIISNCSVNGSSTVTGAMHTGGLVGYGAGLIDKCFTTTNVVSSSQNVGGLVGSADSLKITECFTTGNIKALNIVGGLVGRNVSDSKILGLWMQNCYSLSNIEATHPTNSSAGGLLGISNNDTIIYCYFAGTIKGVELNKGVFVGYKDSSLNTYFDTNVTGFTFPSCSAKSTAEMMKKDTFTGWDFDKVWSIREGETYPYFKRYDITTPINLTAIAGESIVNLSWNSVSNAGRYEVKRSTTIGGPYTTITTISSTSSTTNYTDNTVVNGTTYYYIITASNDFCGQANSNEAVATPKKSEADIPNAPIIIDFGRDGGVYLRWSKVSNATGYIVKRSLIPGGPYINLFDNPINDHGFYDSSADVNTKYYYVVTAVNANGESINSNEISS